MHYALYRKYRPLSFGDVLGQDAITETLRRQVASGQISHAYLFTGTRGTGKTTCAKILARAVNCPESKNGDPCNECAICKGLLEGTLYDVEEIDAASNNGVENIRQIREEVVYAPTAAKYKVYIIDEVHMLSAGAFNALLKTLEEPPSHAIFILATTEIHKVPATILSRCQRFDFLRLPKKTLMEQFRRVLEKEGKSLDENALDLVAELADGSSRDGLSILDKVIDLETYEQVEKVLGVLPKQRIYALLTAAADGNTDAMYRAVEDMYNASADLGRLCTAMMDTMKDVMIFRSSKNPAALLEKSEADAKALSQIADRFPPERILYSLRILQETVAMMPRSLDKRADTEVCMLRLARPDLQPSSEDLAARLATLEQQLQDLKKQSPSPANPVPPSPETIPDKFTSVSKTIPGKLTPAPETLSDELASVPETLSDELTSVPETIPGKLTPAPGTASIGQSHASQASASKRAVPAFEDPFADPSVASAGKYHEPEGPWPSFSEGPEPKGDDPSTQGSFASQKTDDTSADFASASRTSVSTEGKRTTDNFASAFRSSASTAGKKTAVDFASASPNSASAGGGETSGDAFVEGWQPLDAWRDIAHTVSRENRILGFLLEEVPAVYQGRNILVLAEDAEDYREIKSPECMALIKSALTENRKEGYTVKIEHCPADKYIPHATMNYLQKENLFDFEEDEEIPEYDD